VVESKRRRPVVKGRSAGGLGLAILTGLLAAGMGGGEVAAGAQPAVGPRLSVSVRAAGPTAPVVVLTNSGTVPCRVATTSLGTVVLTRVEQGGTAVEPIAFDAAFDDGLTRFVVDGMRTLEPGASAELPVRVVPLGPTGQALETVSASATTAALGSLFPIQAGPALDLDVTYAAPDVSGSPVPGCPTAASAPGASAGGGSESGRAGMFPWGLAVGGGVAALVALLVVGALVRRRRRRGGPAGGAGGTAPLAITLVVLAVASAWVVEPRPASAEIIVDPSLADAWAACSATLHGPGGDPGGILPTLEAPGVSVRLIPANGDVTHEGAISPTDIFVFWDPDDRHPYFGTGGNADPCTTLYHELFHGFEDARGGQDHSPCVTAAGPSGLPVNEVNASRAQNRLREQLGLPPRSHYGDVPLPSGDCLPPERQPRDPECSGRGCADTNGDPHLATFDGVRYDFQAVGEFVAFRDPAGGFEMQVRQEPAAGSRVASVNTVAAMDVVGDRVEVGLDGAELALRVGGTNRPAASGPLPAGGSVELVAASRGSVLVVKWPDGSSVLVTPIGPWGLQISAQPADARGTGDGSLEGLFGDFDGDSSDDIRPRGGQPIPRPTFADLYPTFADSWRVTSEASLFTYEPGTGPDTFTDRTFPDREVTLDELPGRAAAEALCRRRGVVDPAALAACTFDVAITGQADFAIAALGSQTFLGALRLDGREVTASITQRGATARLAFPGTEGQRVFVEVVSSDLPDACGVLELRDPGGRALSSGCIINGRGNIDGTVLPASGEYAVVVDPRDDATGAVTLRLSSTADRSGTVIPNGPPVKASVSAPGAVARLTLGGTGGERLYVEVVSSNLPDNCGVLLLRAPDGSTLSSGCVINGKGNIDGTVLPESGEYAIVVDPRDELTGDVTLKVYSTIDRSGSVTPNGPEATASIPTPGALARLTFTGRAGERLFVDVVSSNLPDNCGVLVLSAPDGSALSSGCVINGKGNIDGTVLPASGDYAIVVDPRDELTGDATLKVYSTSDQVRAISVGGEATATIAAPGAVARLEFTGTEGREVAVDVVSATLPDRCGALQLVGPTGQVVNSGCIIGGKGDIDPTTLPTSGVYSIVVDPSDADTGEVRVRLRG